MCHDRYPPEAKKAESVSFIMGIKVVTRKNMADLGQNCHFSPPQ